MLDLLARNPDEALRRHQVFSLFHQTDVLDPLICENSNKIMSLPRTGPLVIIAAGHSPIVSIVEVNQMLDEPRLNIIMENPLQPPATFTDPNRLGNDCRTIELAYHWRQVRRDFGNLLGLDCIETLITALT